jgi:hypothetical protein
MSGEWRAIKRAGGRLLYGRNVLTNAPSEIRIDPSHSLTTITHEHSKVHQGKYYNTGHYFSAVADNGTALVLIKLSASYENHTMVAVGNGGSARLDVYENPSLSGDGTPVNIENHNRTKALTSPAAVSSSTAFHTPTLSGSPLGYGTQLSPGLVLPGGTKDKGGGALSENAGEQWVFAPSNNYLIKVTNLSGSAQDISIDVSYYEV